MRATFHRPPTMPPILNNNNTPVMSTSNNNNRASINNQTSSATSLGGPVSGAINLNFISNQLSRMGANFEERLSQLESNAKASTTAAPNASVNQRKRPRPFGQPVTPHSSRGEQNFNFVGEMDEKEDILDDEVVSIDDEHTGASDLENENDNESFNDKKQAVPAFLNEIFKNTKNIFKIHLTKEKKENILKRIPKTLTGAEFKLEVPVLAGEFSQKARPATKKLDKSIVDLQKGSFMF
eukprot:TRINITY_DN1347_c0_g1_i3.p1 TRINITY_DN1347_c0_g1~~TRINITY_DN1347_c0_g1_i3.p1  ORF type:complete len:238 (-),score=53.70 TRINITY_DN1347_c0_g1_i3:453-1166(-)